MNRDVAFGVMTLAVSAGYYALASRIPSSQLADAVGPSGMPIAYAALLAVLSLVLIVRSVRAGQGPGRRTVSAAGARGGPRVAGVVGAGIGYVLLVPLAGYAASVGLLMLVTSWLQGRPMDRRSVWVSVAGAALLWALFVWVLRVPYPTGRWVPFA